MTAHPTREHRSKSRWPAAIAGLCVLASLAACNKDTEDAFKSEVDAWLSLGTTHFFHTTRTCTGAVFDVRSGIVKSSMRSVTSWNETQFALNKGRGVAFENLSVSPSHFTGTIMGENPSLGTKMISAGLAIRDCLNETHLAQYHATLNDPSAVLIYDPTTETIGVISADGARIYVGRGKNV